MLCLHICSEFVDIAAIAPWAMMAPLTGGQGLPRTFCSNLQNRHVAVHSNAFQPQPHQPCSPAVPSSDINPAARGAATLPLAIWLNTTTVNGIANLHRTANGGTMSHKYTTDIGLSTLVDCMPVTA